MATLLSNRPKAAGPTVASPPPTGQRQLDEVIGRLQEGARRFLKLSLDERVALARAMQAGYLVVAEDSVRAACLNKGIALGTPLEGEEWTLGPWCAVRHLRLVQQSLLAIKHTGNTRVGKIGRTFDDRLAVQVFPASGVDGILFNGVGVDVHLRPGVTEEEFHTTRASFYKAPAQSGRVVLVLGAGNVDAIPSQDVISKLFNEGKVCLLKMNPVNAYLGPYLETAFAAPIEQGFLAIVYGGAAEGGYLVNHPGIDEIHLTGSDRTFDHIVWGPPGAAQTARKAAGTPLISKPVTAELGNISPVLVVPGPYSDKQLAYQAEDVAGGVTCNASFNCNAVKMIVTPRGWKRREQLLSGVESVLGATAPRKAYYPGAAERWHQLVDGHPNARRLGAEAADSLPWTILPDLDPTDRNEKAFAMEPFCSIVSETSVGSEDPVEFLDRAVTFANERLWGTLSAGLVVHPQSMKDPRIAQAVERAIGRLRYGVVAVNAWSGLVFAFGTAPWGAHPGSSLADIQSGTGWVHNTPMIEGIEKAVLRHPVTMKPKPPYFPSHRTALTQMKRMTRLEEQGSWGRVPGVIAAAMGG